jgi:hypothetical protein
MSTYSTTSIDLVSQTRLESSITAPSMTETIKAQVHDALWMLTQQNRVGEYNAEDAGTPISVKVALNKTKLNRLQATVNSSVEYNSNVPLEARVERMPLVVDFRTRLTLGNYWIKLMRRSFASNLTQFTAYLNVFKAAYSISLPPSSASLTTDDLSYNSDKVLVTLNTLSANNTFDGYKLYLDLTGASAIHAKDIQGISSTHASVFDEIETNFLEWVNTIYFKGDNEPTYWSNGSLDYSFNVSAPLNSDGSEQVVLQVKELSSGNLDWYNFNILEAPSTLPDSNISDANIFESETKTLLPTKLVFKGMTNERWWQFEDRDIDLKYLETNLRNSSKLSLQEFALSHGNDWFVIPIDTLVGSILEAENLQVQDVFGELTHIERAGEGPSSSWWKWSMFNMDSVVDLDSKLNTDGKLFIAPSLHSSLESEPFEKVSFMADELANIVWGIEEIVPNQLHTGKSIIDAENAFLRQFDIVKQALSPMSPNTLLANSSVISYKIGNNVPGNWIPFVNVNSIAINGRTYSLMRGRIEQIIDGYDTEEYTTPRTMILRNTSSVAGALNSLYINNEEMALKSVQVTGSYQRARWFNGRTYTWYARKRQVGKGPVTSGVKFDEIEPRVTN